MSERDAPESIIAHNVWLPTWASIKGRREHLLKLVMICCDWLFVNFIDLPSELTQLCVNMSELLGSSKSILLMDSLDNKEQQVWVLFPDDAQILLRWNNGCLGLMLMWAEIFDSFSICCQARQAAVGCAPMKHFLHLLGISLCPWYLHFSSLNLWLGSPQSRHACSLTPACTAVTRLCNPLFENLPLPLARPL